MRCSAILIVAGSVQIWHIVVIEILFGTAEAFFRPAATALLPQTVPEEEIQEANAVTAMFGNLAEFAGPALADGTGARSRRGSRVRDRRGDVPRQRRLHEPGAAAAAGSGRCPTRAEHGLE